MFPPPRLSSSVSSDHPLRMPPPPPLTDASFVEQPTAPPLSTVASSRPISSPPSLPDMNASSDSDSVHSASPKKHPQLFHAPLLFQPHAFTEASRSACLPLRAILILRLFPVAALVGHLVFFSLHADFNFTEYLTWNYLALTIALLLALTCSLLDLIHDHPDQQDNENSPSLNSNHQHILDDVERQSRISSSPSSAPEPKWLLFFTRITVPLYQLAVTATLFGAVVFWAAVYPNASIPPTYALLAQAVAAPAIALTDFFLSFRMNFRLIYLVPYMLYNAAYIAVAYTLTERAYLFVFLRRDASRSAFLAKAAGLAAGSLFTAILLYFITALRSLRSTKSLPDAISARSKSRIVEDRAESASASGASSHHSDLSQLGLRRVPSNSFYGSAEFVHVENEERLEQSRSLSARDRSSVPINLGGNSSARSSFFRMSSARLTASLSGGSSGEGRGLVRNTSTSSMWDDMEQPPPKTEDEVFSMPACYKAGKPADVVRLPQAPAADSAKQIPRVISRQASGSFSRTSSTSSTRIPGPAPHLPSSAFTAPLVVRNSSALYSTDRKSWRGGGAGSR